MGGGSNAIGSFYHFIEDEGVRLIGCEAAGRGVDTFETAATIATGRVGIFHGMKSYFCQDKDGQIAPVYSISAGLDYPDVGPEHAYLHDTGRAEYVPVTDEEAVNAFEYLARTEGIIPAIESAHAVAHAMKIAPAMDKDQIIVNLKTERLSYPLSPAAILIWKPQPLLSVLLQKTVRILSSLVSHSPIPLPRDPLSREQTSEHLREA